MSFYSLFGMMGLVLLSTPFGEQDHDFKMSICEIIHQPEQGNVMLKIYLFADDLTQTLTGNASAPLPDRNAISQYVGQHIQLKINDYVMELEFAGLRQKDEQVLLQYQTRPNGFSAIGTIQLTNTLLLEQFKDQSNIVYAIQPGKNKQTQMLNHSTTVAYFKN